MTHTELAALKWYQDMGVDIAIIDAPYNRLLQKIDMPSFIEPSKPLQVSERPQEIVKTNIPLLESAKIKAAQCDNLDQLSTAITNFDGHPLKKTASNLVFGAGNPQADVMIIGDPPSNNEDRSGNAFSGDDGQLLDKVLQSISLSRDTVYLTHITHWRPPGNSTPTAEHLMLSQPFIEKQIELIAPKYIIILGITAAKTLLDVQKSLSRIRGNWLDYGSQKIPTMVTYTPAFLLKNPLQKRKVWQDMLAFKSAIDA